MRTWQILLAISSITLVSCKSDPPRPSDDGNTIESEASADGLRLTVEIAEREIVTGSSPILMTSLTNHGSDPIRIWGRFMLGDALEISVIGPDAEVVVPNWTDPVHSDYGDLAEVRLPPNGFIGRIMDLGCESVDFDLETTCQQIFAFDQPGEYTLRVAYVYGCIELGVGTDDCLSQTIGGRWQGRLETPPFTVRAVPQSEASRQ